MISMVEQLEKEGFTRDQIDEIAKGLEAGLDVSVYAKKDFLAIQMRQIRLGLVGGLSVEKYAKTEYDWFQMKEIRKGMEEQLDITLFASPDISYDRMHQIRLGLHDGIDLSAYKRLDSGILKQMRLAIMNHVNIVSYIIAGYDEEQLEVIREALEKKIDIQPWVSVEYRGIALREILIGLENGLDVSSYANPGYSWQQMREIRLGIEHMVDIQLYKSSFYSYRQMKEIREGLEDGLDVSCYSSPMYTAAEMHKRRMLLEENPSAILSGNSEKLRTESEKEQEKEQEKERDEKKAFRIMLSVDEMEAYLEVFESFKGIDRLEIVKMLREKGICYGIQYDVIDDVLSGKHLHQSVLIASGKRPVNGDDGWYEYYFRTDLSDIPEQLANGSLDYTDADWFEIVDKDQKLAEYHCAQKGEAGISITGKTIPAKNGREKSLLVGKGFTRLSDGKTYVADMRGIVTLSDSRLNVSELLVLPEVNMSTGFVAYDGNVLVEGNVRSGSIIKASGDVVVNGFVEAAQIICGGNVFIRKGMNGSESGCVKAEKNVFGYFFEDAEVYAGENIQGDYFFKSVLYANGTVKSAGKKGVIAGGDICARRGLHAISLGNPAELPTNIKLGFLDTIREKEKELYEVIRSVNQELYILQNAHMDFKKKYTPEIRNSMEIYLKIESAIYTKEKQMEKLMIDKNVIEGKIIESGAVKAVVDGPVYEGVTVEIDGARWQAKNMNGVIIKHSGNGIAVFSNY